MKKYIMILFMIFITATVWAGMRDRSSDIELYGEKDSPGHYVNMPELSAAPGTPESGTGNVYCIGNDLYFKDDAGVATSLIGAAAGGSTTLDEAYDGGGAGAGATINADAGPVLINGSGADIALQAKHAGSGNTIDIINSGTGKDIDGTSSTWSVTKLGAAVFATVGAHDIIADVNVDDGVTDSPAFTFIDATNETAAFVKTDAGVLGLTTDATDGLNVLVGNLFVGNGTAGTAAMDGEDAYIEGELEVDGACEFDGAVNIDGVVDIDAVVTLENGLTIDNAVNNSLEWNENSEEIKWTFNSDDLAIVSTTGVVELSLFDDAADVKLTHAANGAADDFYIQQTGAQDASLFIQSAGTGADALSLSASAGGVDISAPATFDIDITATGGTVKVIASEAAADQFKVDAQGVIVGDAINLETTDGGIMLNADGGSNGDIELNAADDLAITAAGTIAIDSADWDITATGAATLMASVGFDSATVLYRDIVELSNVDIKALNGTPKVLVSTPGADKFIELVSLTLVLDYGSNVLTEGGDNLVVEYGTSNDDVTATIEMTGFIDQAADTIMIVGPTWPLAANAATDMVNNTLELYNIGGGAGEFAGNAGADTTITVHIAYRIHTAGL